MARKFIEAAADNIYRNLRYYNGRGKDVSVYMKEVDSFRKQIGSTTTIESLMGVEGNIRKQYYAAWNIIINQEISFEKRVMHPPDNMINSLISFVNTLGRQVSYQYLIRLEAYKLIKHLIGEKEYEGFRIWW